MKFFQQRERQQDSTNTSKRPEEEIAKVTQTRRWTDTHRHLLCPYCTLLLLLPLCFFPAVSFQQRTEITEPGLCCVCRVPNTRMLWSNTEPPSGTGQARFSTCAAPVCALPLPFISQGCFGWEQLCPSIVTVPKNKAAGFANPSEQWLVQEDVAEQHSKQPVQYKITDMQQPGSKNHPSAVIQGLNTSSGMEAAQLWTGELDDDSQQKSKSYMPEIQSLGQPQKQASPVDKLQCGLLIVGIERCHFL